ncbi:unnamed protein product [Ascophyllum nodosum]
MLSYVIYQALGHARHGELSLIPQYNRFAALVQPPLQRQRVQHRTILWGGQDATTAAAAASSNDSPARGDLTSEKRHSEQRSGFQPPLPLEDDGHVVDMSSLHNLVESGALQVAKRPSDYSDRRTDGYTEPMEIYVLGTSHASEASARDAQQVIRAVRPQSVVVELCKSRAGLMMPVEDDHAAVGPLTMSGENFIATLLRSIRLGGQSTALLRAALAWAAQGSMNGDGDTAKPAMAMYGEFRAARESAEQEGAQIVLGDRPVEITLQRAWEGLSLGEKRDLVFSFGRLAFERARVRFGTSGVEEDDTGASEKVRWIKKKTATRLRRLQYTQGIPEHSSLALRYLRKSIVISRSSSGLAELLRQSARSGDVDEDTLEDLFSALAERFPSVIAPLIYERDLYLAWTLKRSRAVCGQRRVVGVVGRGHLSGVMKAITADRGGDTLVFKELAGRQGGEGGAEKNEPSRNLARFVARIAAETAIGYAIWEVYKRSTA